MWNPINGFLLFNSTGMKLIHNVMESVLALLERGVTQTRFILVFVVIIQELIVQ